MTKTPLGQGFRSWKSPAGCCFYTPFVFHQILLLAILAAAAYAGADTVQDRIGALEPKERMTLPAVALWCGQDIDETTEFLVVIHEVMRRSGITETLAEFIATAAVVADLSSLRGEIVSTTCVEWIMFYVGLRLTGAMDYDEARSLVYAMILDIQNLRADVETVARNMGVMIE